MNLIEQLGGYEKVKGYIVDANACRAFDDEKKLKSALLEYRRENGIFEVGDKLVEVSYLDDTTNEIGIYDGKSFHGYTCVKFYESLIMADEADFRHATDDEIKVGHRI